MKRWLHAACGGHLCCPVVRCSLLSLLFAAIFFATPLRAETYSWRWDTSNVWDFDGAWQPTGIPTNGDTASINVPVFPTGAPKTPNIFSFDNAFAYRVIVGSDFRSGTNVPTPSLNIVGTLNATIVDMGLFSNSHGIVYMNPGAVWNGKVIGVGGAGTGRLDVAGGTISATFLSVNGMSVVTQAAGTVSLLNVPDTGYPANLLISSGGVYQLQGGVLRLGGDNAILGDGNLNLAGGKIEIINSPGLGDPGDVFTAPKGVLLVNSTSSGINVDSNVTSATWEGVISGSGSVKKQGPGTLRLAATNTHSGSIWIEEGTLEASINQNLGVASSLLTFSGGRFRPVASFTLGRTVLANTAPAIFDVPPSVTLSNISQMIGGMGLRKEGSGTLIAASANNNMTGQVEIVSGVLRAGNATGLNTNSHYVPQGAGVLDLNDFSLAMLSLSGNGTVELGTGTLTLVQSVNSVFSGAIHGGGSLVKTGPGTLTLDGVATNSGGLTIRGGALEVAGSSARLRHTQSLILVGNLSGETGTFRVANSGVATTRFARVGHNSGSVGHAEVTGAGSSWVNYDGVALNDLHLGLDGTGSLTISNQGAAICRDGTLGYFSGNGLAVVTDTNSVWSISHDLLIGRQGTGSLTLRRGGVVAVGGGTGTAIVAQLNGSVGALNIGAATNGVSQAPGILNAAVVGGGAGSASVVFNHTSTNYYFTGDGSPTSEPIRITGGARVIHQDGRTYLTGSNTYSGGTVINGGELHVNTTNTSGTGTGNVTMNGGVLGGSGIVGGNTFVQAGILFPGPVNAIGTLTFSGALTFQSALSGILLQFSTLASHDKVRVLGAGGVTYNGVLSVQSIGSHIFVEGDTIQLFEATAYSGAFTTIFLPLLPPGLAWDTSGLALDGSIKVRAEGLALTHFSAKTSGLMMGGFGGAPGEGYSIWTHTNLMAPLGSWFLLHTGLLDGAGSFAFTNAVIGGERERFYRFETP